MAIRSLRMCIQRLQTDIFIFLLRHLQNNSMKELVEGIKTLRERDGFTPATLANDFKEDFGVT